MMSIHAYRAYTKSDFQNLLIILSRSTTNSICFKKNKEGMRTGFGIRHTIV
jgi:hypothetical protein